MSEDKKARGETDASTPPVYEAPAIEEIVTTEEMEREVHYAGDGTVRIG